jgi:hypothetical protein
MVGARAQVLSFALGSLVTPQMIERPVPAFQVDEDGEDHSKDSLEPMTGNLGG